MTANRNIGSTAYKEAGVDTDKAADLIERIKPHVKKTMRSGVMSGIGSFGALFDLKETGFKDPVLVSGTDGVGTKIKIAIDIERHDTIGIDAVAMCVNDIVVQGAQPLFFLDYFATGRLNNNVAEDVIAGIAEGCEQAGCALIGGETAEMPGLYADGDYDIAGFCVGAVEREDLVSGADIAEGDVILGLASNGLHSNGFSLVRKVVESERGALAYETKSPFDPELTIGELALAPTRIYVRSVLEALKVKNAQGKAAIKGMAHITGGGFVENIPRVLPEGLGAVLDAESWALPPFFRWLAEIGELSHDDMAATLNCGIGFVVVCAPDHAQDLIDTFKAQGETVQQIGHVTAQSDDEAPRLIMINREQAWA